MTPEELRRCGDRFGYAGDLVVRNICHDVADTLERLQRENAELEQQVAALRADADTDSP